MKIGKKPTKTQAMMDVQILTGTSTYLEAAFTWGGEKAQREVGVWVPLVQLSHYPSSDDVTVHGADQDKQTGTRMQNAPKNFQSLTAVQREWAALQVQIPEIVWEFSIFLPDLKEQKGDHQTWERTFKSKAVIKSPGIPGTLSFYNLAAGCPDFFHA